jgi:hypothetical protein
MVPRPSNSRYPTLSIGVLRTSPSMPLWRVAVAAVLIMLFAIATADISPASAKGKVYAVPSKIDATGSQDVSGALQSFIDKAPNGSTIVFKAGGRYRLDKGLQLWGRRNLTLDGNGAQLDLPRTDRGYDSIGIRVEIDSVGTTIRNLTMVGDNHQAGTSDACCDREANHGIAVLSADDTLIENVHIRRVWGDCLYVNSGYGRAGDWSDGVTFRDSTCRLTGRHGVAVEGGKRVRIANNVFDQIGMFVVDIEPWHPGEGASDVVIRDNSIVSYGLTGTFAGKLLQVCGPLKGSVVRDVTVTGNTVEGNRGGWNGKMLGLHIEVCGTDRIRENFTITNNIAKSTVDASDGWPVMLFTDVKGVTVTGNVQPISSGGKLAGFSGSTNVTYDG